MENKLTVHIKKLGISLPLYAIIFISLGIFMLIGVSYLTIHLNGEAKKAATLYKETANFVELIKNLTVTMLIAFLVFFIFLIGFFIKIWHDSVEDKYSRARLIKNFADQNKKMDQTIKKAEEILNGAKKSINELLFRLPQLVVDSNKEIHTKIAHGLLKQELKERIERENIKPGELLKEILEDDHVVEGVLQRILERGDLMEEVVRNCILKIAKKARTAESQKIKKV